MCAAADFTYDNRLQLLGLRYRGSWGNKFCSALSTGSAWLVRPGSPSDHCERAGISELRTSGLFLPQRHGCIVGLSIEARQAPREWEVSGEEDGANAMGEIQKDMVPSAD